jgi:hypothetical protein
MPLALDIPFLFLSSSSRDSPRTSLSAISTSSTFSCWPVYVIAIALNAAGMTYHLAFRLLQLSCLYLDD